MAKKLYKITSYRNDEGIVPYINKFNICDKSHLGCKC